MKQIIKNRKYDTETAREVGMASHGQGWRDHSYYEETLYCKRTGEYFLFGEGGPATKYAVSAGQNCWSGGSRIIPLSFDNASKWAEENLSASQYEEEFGEVKEDDSMTTMSFSLPSDVAEMIRRRAREQGVSISGYIASLIK